MNCKEHECFGNLFEAMDPLCRRCLIGSRCQDVTRIRKSGCVPDVPDEENMDVIEDIPEQSPFDYLISSLDGKFERADRENESASGIFFKREEKTVVQVVTSKSSGRVNIKGESFERILDSKDSIKTIDDAEEIIRILLKDII